MLSRQILPKAARFLQSALGPQLLNFSSESSSTLDQVNDHDDDGNYDQDMDEPAANVGEEAEKPKHEQDNNDSPEHGIPFD